MKSESANYLFWAWHSRFLALSLNLPLALDQFILADLRYLALRQSHVPSELGREQVLFGIQGSIPGHRLAGISGHPAHDRGQRALSDSLELVDRLAGSDAFDQIGVLLDIRIDVLTSAVISPFGFADDLQ